MTKKKFLKIFVCAAMALLMAVGIGLPVIVSADTKSDYRQAQDKLNQINKELESIKNEKKKQEQQKKNAETQLSLVKNQISILISYTTLTL